ncbi:MAG: hypothetical protein ABIH78_03080 [Candidatus Peregrinibacteria bacterium]
MKKIFIAVLAMLATSIVTVSTASAFNLEAAQNVFLSKSLSDDAYVFAGNANVDADIAGDLIIAGGNVVVNGNVLEDVLVVGGRVTIMGNIGGDLRVFGGQITIFGNVGDDVITAGGQIDIAKSSTISGSVLAGSGILTIGGEVKEDVRGAMGVFILNGTVGRDVVVTIEDTLSVSESAKIGGDLNYSAIIEAKIPAGIVSGETSFNQFEKKNYLKGMTYAYLLKKGIDLTGALLITLILVLTIPKLFVNSGNITRERVLKSLGIGVLTVLIGLVGSIILMITLIGLPIGLITLALLFVAMYMAKIFVAAWITSYMVNYHKKAVSKVKLFFGMALVLVLYYAIGTLPVVGWIFNLILFFIGVGAIMYYKKDVFGFLKAKAKI